ncbi:GAF domain-containing protein [Modicisalibacter luteus]|uniref:GAF domain-containing protein n=1 Tax=Modicisalibacter luteus TaxID=453962 RepID=UPI0036347200
MKATWKALEAQQAIQDLIAQDAPLEDTLAGICQMIEQQSTGALSSIMLCDTKTQTLSLAAGNLPTAFKECLQSIPIGPEVGSCGRAAYWQKLVVTEDIQQDTCWEGYRALASASGLRACWSYPVLSKGQHHLLGTFAIYYPFPGPPSPVEIEQIKRAVGLVALAVERRQDHRTLRENRQRYRSLFTHHPDVVFPSILTEPSPAPTRPPPLSVGITKMKSGAVTMPSS